MGPQDVLHAWRDFECSFFAGALLAPKAPFRRFLARESYRVEAGEKIDLVPALRSHGVDVEAIVNSIAEACLHHHGEAKIPERAAEAIRGAARVLNIAWVEEALLKPARIICPRSAHCPRTEPCDSTHVSRAREITDVRKEIVSAVKRGR